MKRKRRVSRKVGDIVAIPLGEGRVGFGWVLEEPLVAFFASSSDEEQLPSVQDILRMPIAFRIWAMNHALTSGDWSVIGHSPISEEMAVRPWFFRQDSLTGKVTRTQTGNEDVPVGTDELDALECAAVWDPAHVIDRLRDFFAGRPNKWVDSMKPQRSKL